MILPKLNSRCAFLWTLLSTTVLALLAQPGWFDGPVASSSASSDVPGGSSTDTDDHSGLDGDSFVQRWLLLAPIPFAANESASDAFYREQIKDEARLTPKAGEKVKFGDTELIWQKKASAGHLLDFNAILGKQNDRSVAYAVSYLVAPKELKGIKMKTGSDDQCRVYLNGEEVFNYPHCRALEKDQDTTEVTLLQGINVLVAKVVNCDSEWAFCVRFTDRDDRPLTGLKAQDWLTGQPAKPAILATSPADKRLTPFDKMMTDFLKTRRDVLGATLTIARGGKIIYSRGFGTADGKTTMQANAKMRIASISKSITAVAILQLVERGKLRLDANVFDVLDLEDPMRGFDPRWRQITIHQLLQHTGGWDSGKSFDPMFHNGPICEELKIKSPAMQKDIIRYMLGKPLDFTPGDRASYSNFGYCLLGRVIEKVTGLAYEDYVRREVQLPVGARDAQLGKTLRDQRLPGEVFYAPEGKCTSYAILDPDVGDYAILGPDLGKLVLHPYGASCLEAMDSHGGWVSTAPDLVRFASAFDHPDRCPLLQAKSIDTMFACPAGAAGHDKNGKEKDEFFACGWEVHRRGKGIRDTLHSGVLGGTSTLLFRRGADHLTWAVLFNGHSGSRFPPANGMEARFYAAAKAVTEWP